MLYTLNSSEKNMMLYLKKCEVPKIFNVYAISRNSNTLAHHGIDDINIMYLAERFQFFFYTVSVDKGSIINSMTGVVA